MSEILDLFLTIYIIIFLIAIAIGALNLIGTLFSIGFFILGLLEMKDYFKNYK